MMARLMAQERNPNDAMDDHGSDGEGRKDLDCLGHDVCVEHEDQAISIGDVHAVAEIEEVVYCTETSR